MNPHNFNIPTQKDVHSLMPKHDPPKGCPIYPFTISLFAIISFLKIWAFRALIVDS